MLIFDWFDLIGPNIGNEKTAAETLEDLGYDSEMEVGHVANLIKARHQEGIEQQQSAFIIDLQKQIADAQARFAEANKQWDDIDYEHAARNLLGNAGIVEAPAADAET